MDSSFDESKLTHEQIISLCDADVDGFHISCLLAVFFFKHMPGVIKNGHFYIASAPLYKVEENGKSLFFNNNDEYNRYVAKRILNKYSVGRVVRKEGTAVLKPFKEEEFVQLLDNTEMYRVKLNNLSNLNAIDSSLIEFITINMNNIDTLPKKIEKQFPEVKVTVNKKKVIHIEGMIKDNYQFIDIDKKFFESLNEIYDIVCNNNYKSLYYKEKDKKANKVFLGEFLDKLLAYGTPKHRVRYKGLGEMDDDELWYTTMRPEAGGIVQIKANSMEELAKVFDTHFSVDASKRKIFLETFEISPNDIDN